MQNPLTLLSNAWKARNERSRQKYDRAYLDRGEAPLSIRTPADEGGGIALFEATKTDEGRKWLDRLAKKLTQQENTTI